MATNGCEICGKACHSLAYACVDCKRLLDRIYIRGWKRNLKTRRAALRAAWDGQVFRCFYTGWPLTISDPTSPLHFTWEHRTPGSEDDIVVAAALINAMKSDLTERQFRELVIDLGRHFSDSTYVVPVVDPIRQAK